MKNKKGFIMTERFNEIIKKIITMLTDKGIDIEKKIDEYEQLKNWQKRIDGYQFIMKDYLKGLFHAIASQQRKWEVHIKPYIDQIDDILFSYDSESLLNANQEELYQKIKATGANIFNPNKAIENLINNIPKLQVLYPLIEKEFGTLEDDEFIVRRINKFAKQLSDSNSDDKLNGIGEILVREFFKNIGIPSMKPDVHLKRIGGRDRLGFFKSIKDEEQLQIDFYELAKSVNIKGINGLAKITYLDNLIWMFGADKVGDICNAKANNCKICLLKNVCNLPESNK